MALGLITHDWLNLPWERARGYVSAELSQFRTAFQRQWSRSFQEDGTVRIEVVPAISLSDNVTGELPFSSLPDETASTLLGRGDSGDGEIQEIVIGPGLAMTGETLSVTVVPGTGTVTHVDGALTDHALVVGNAANDVEVLTDLGTTVKVLHGNASGDPTWSQVALTSDVSGDLPFSNLTQIAGLSVLGVTGNSTADVAAITAGSDGDILKRSGTSLVFGPPATVVQALTQIQQITTSGSQTTIDFTSIPGGYTSLMLKGQGRDTAAGASFSLNRLLINNDTTAANYVFPSRIITTSGAANGTGQASSVKGAVIMPVPNDGNTAGRVSDITITINNYSGTTFWKWITANYATGFGTTADAGIYFAEWASTAAITRVTATTDGTAFLNGLVWTLYGIT